MIFFCARQATKSRKGEKCSPSLWEKQLQSVLVGNWPRLETSINQRYVSASNKATAVATVKQIHSVYILVDEDGTNQHWIAAFTTTWPPTHSQQRASTSDLPSATWDLYETEPSYSILKVNGPMPEQNVSEVISKGRFGAFLTQCKESPNVKIVSKKFSIADV